MCGGGWEVRSWAQGAAAEKGAWRAQRSQAAMAGETGATPGTSSSKLAGGEALAWAQGSMVMSGSRSQARLPVLALATPRSRGTSGSA